MPQTQVRVFRDAKGKVPIAEWLDTLELREPNAHAKCLQRILLLGQLGNELRRPLADLLRDGIYELRAKTGGVHYRLLYFFSGSNAAVVSHGITKEGKVPDGEIEKALKRKQLIQENSEKYTADWPLEK